MSASPRMIQEFSNAAIAAHPSLNIVIKNAGVALLGAFNEVDQAQMEWLININSGAWCTAPRVPAAFAKQREAQSSTSPHLGIIAPPGQTAYCAAKFAVRGFSEKPAA